LSNGYLSPPPLSIFPSSPFPQFYFHFAFFVCCWGAHLQFTSFLYHNHSSPPLLSKIRVSIAWGFMLFPTYMAVTPCLLTQSLEVCSCQLTHRCLNRDECLSITSRLRREVFAVSAFSVWWQWHCQRVYKNTDLNPFYRKSLHARTQPYTLTNTFASTRTYQQTNTRKCIDCESKQNTFHGLTLYVAYFWYTFIPSLICFILSNLIDSPFRSWNSKKEVECIEVEYMESDSLQRRNHLWCMLCVVEATAPSGPLWLLRN